MATCLDAFSAMRNVTSAKSTFELQWGCKGFLLFLSFCFSVKRLPEGRLGSALGKLAPYDRGLRGLRAHGASCRPYRYKPCRP